MTIKPKYSVLIRALSEDDGGGWIAVVPDLPGCMSDGKTQMEALHNVEDAIETWIAIARKHGKPIPQEDDFVTRSFYLELPDDMRAQAQTMARQMLGVRGDAEPDPDFLNAIYAQMARSTITRSHL